MSFHPDDVFDEVLKAKTLFASKEALTEHFLPERLPFREREMRELARILAPCLRRRPVSNALIYGNPGTGKTAVTRSVLARLQDKAQELKVQVQVLYANCGVKGLADTEYRTIRAFLANLGQEIPRRGWSKTEAYDLFFELIDQRPQHVVVVFDEIDNLMRNTGQQFLYTFTRIELRKAKLSFVGITNNVTLMNHLDGRIRSSLSQQQVLFPPYDAQKLTTILSERAQVAFLPDVVDPAAISMCAALGAQEHGDARRSLKVLHAAGEVAEAEGAQRVSVNHVVGADQKISRDTLMQLIHVQPWQHLMVLHCIFSLWAAGKRPIQTNDVYGEYTTRTSALGRNILTTDRVPQGLSDDGRRARLSSGLQCQGTRSQLDGIGSEGRGGAVFWRNGAGPEPDAVL